LVSFKDFKCFGSDAATIGVLRNAYRRKNLSGWYNSAAFEKEAKKAVMLRALMVMLFSDEVKRQTLELIKLDLGQLI
jgi:enoyl-[acyl-carrier protein] reductase/trans-2-enoyl-CoA reductase (NAD+)